MTVPGSTVPPSNNRIPLFPNLSPAYPLAMLPAPAPAPPGSSGLTRSDAAQVTGLANGQGGTTGALQNPSSYATHVVYTPVVVSDAVSNDQAARAVDRVTGADLGEDRVQCRVIDRVTGATGTFGSADFLSIVGATATAVGYLAGAVLRGPTEAGPVSVLAQSTAIGIVNSSIGTYNTTVALIAGIYNTNALNLNGNSAVRDPIGAYNTQVAAVLALVAQYTAAVSKLATDTVTLTTTTINNLRTQTVDPAVAGATATVNNTVTQVGTLYNNTLIAVNKAVADTSTAASQRLAEAQAAVGTLDDQAIAAADKAQADVNAIKAATVDPAVANAIQVVTGALSGITTTINNLRAQVDGIVSGAPGQVDEALADVGTATAGVQTVVDGYVTAATNAASQVRTGTVDPVVATATAVVNGYLAQVAPTLASATKTITDAAANFSAQIATLRAQVEAEAAKQEAAANKTITDQQVFLMGQVANVSQTLLAQVGTAQMLVAQVAAQATAEALRILALLTAQTVDRPLFYGALSSPVTIGASTDVVVIPPGGLTITAN